MDALISPSLRDRLAFLLNISEHVVFCITLLKFIAFVRKNGLQGLIKSIVGGVMASAKMVPGVAGVVQGELDKEVKKMEDNMLGDGDPDAILQIPEKGLPAQELITRGQALHDKDNFSTGKRFAGIYSDITERESTLDKLQIEMWKTFHHSNALYPQVFKSCRKFEAELISMVLNMLHGRNGQECGFVTSGGTESILIAILAYRELAFERGIMEPEVICARTSHGALSKACHYFGVKLVTLVADTKTQQLTLDIVKSAINKNTIAVYASAPTFPHGIVDPIDQLGPYLKKKNIGLHVDNCLGGFLLSSLQKEGLFKRKFDFEVEGVTTISCDVHKFGFSPKGVSTVLFKDEKLRGLTIHPVTNGLTLYVTSTLQGSRGWGTIAAAWATVLHIGESGYRSIARDLHEMARKVEKFVEGVEGIHCPLKSDCAIVPIASNDRRIDIYKVSALMEQKGWGTFTSRDPPMMALCVGKQYHNILDTWLADLKVCVDGLRTGTIKSVPEGSAAVYGAAEMIPDEILGDLMKSYVNTVVKVKKKAV